MPEVVDATLTKIQRNQILTLIQKYGPPPNEFEWSEKQQNEYHSMSYRPYKVSVLTHCPTGYYCIFGAHTVTTSPGITKKVEEFSHGDNRERRENACGKWLIIVKIEVDAPDLWTSIGQERSLPTVASSPDLDNCPFTPAEQMLIADRLDEIQAYVLEGQQFNSAQAQYIHHEFEYLKESSRRFGRKDWLRVLLGVLIGQAINLALPPAKAKGLLALAGAAFQSLWGAVHGYLQ